MIEMVVPSGHSLGFEMAVPLVLQRVTEWE